MCSTPSRQAATTRCCSCPTWCSRLTTAVRPKRCGRALCARASKTSSAWRVASRRAFWRDRSIDVSPYLTARLSNRLQNGVDDGTAAVLDLVECPAERRLQLVWLAHGCAKGAARLGDAGIVGARIDGGDDAVVGAHHGAARIELGDRRLGSVVTSIIEYDG